MPFFEVLTSTLATITSVKVKDDGRCSSKFYIWKFYNINWGFRISNGGK
jgi:hypothetical protein